MARKNVKEELTSIEAVLDLIDKLAQDRDRVSIAVIMESMGRRSFGPVLLVTGIIITAPIIGYIPGVPTLMGMIVLLTSLQLLFHRDHFWLPQWILRRSMDQGKLRKAISWMRPVARFIDRFTRPRFKFLTNSAGNHLIAVMTILMVLVIPLMEFIPGSGNVAGIFLMICGLAVTARDGLLAMIAIIFIVVAFLFFGFAIYYFPLF